MTAARIQAPAPRILCRSCTAQDAAGIVDLLCSGFPDRPRPDWERGLGRLVRHAERVGNPVLGQVLESEGRLVGVLLTIQGAGPADEGKRCNVSSWYVEPPFRGYAPLLLTRASRDKGVTYFNISPATHTRPIIEAQGFRRYGTGRFWSFPWAARPRRLRLTRLNTPDAVARRFEGADRMLLVDHLAWGCLAAAADDGGGPEPLIFLPRLTRGLVPTAQLIYCRDIARIVDYAGPIGRWLLRRGFPVLAVDSEGAVPGLPGRFAPDAVPKYFKGPVRPRLGDLSYSELVMFGP